MSFGFAVIRFALFRLRLQFDCKRKTEWGSYFVLDPKFVGDEEAETGALAPLGGEKEVEYIFPRKAPWFARLEDGPKSLFFRNPLRFIFPEEGRKRPG